MVVLPPWESVHLVAGEKGGLEKKRGGGGEQEKAEREREGEREKEKERSRRLLEMLKARPATPRREKRRKVVSDAVEEVRHFWGCCGEGLKEDGQRCASGFSAAQQPPTILKNKCWFVSGEVAHRDKAWDGDSSLRAPIWVMCTFFPI